ncbi:MAG TPA: ATP-dependent sacrificial sulfur transferase LarE [Ruminiclostridium sp.]|nr:ATP-dependent sacrificial sulfur transferase LarE [Ruminiclostridium sp.]
MELDSKLQTLFSYLKGLEKVCIAFSAGIDSSFLLESAHRALNGNVLAVMARGSMMPQKEIDYGREFCKSRSIQFIEIEANEFEVEAFANNTPDRCYYCKHAIFSKIIKTAEENGFHIVLEGTNLDDMGDYRPGRKALAELGIKSPLLECGFTKNEIRAFAREMDIDIWDKPAAACLATRVPTGEKVTPELLKRIEVSEDAIKQLGFRQVRVRVHGSLARIEIPADGIEKMCRPAVRDEVSRKLKDAGFRYVSIDLDGYKTGNMN